MKSHDAIRTGYILGAGASLTAGYPLAKDIASAMECFIARLSERQECAELSAWCKETLDLMAHENCQSLDELAFVLRERDRCRAEQCSCQCNKPGHAGDHRHSGNPRGFKIIIEVLVITIPFDARRRKQRAAPRAHARTSWLTPPAGLSAVTQSADGCSSHRIRRPSRPAYWRRQTVRRPVRRRGTVHWPAAAE